MRFRLVPKSTTLDDLEVGAVLRWGRGHLPLIHLLPPSSSEIKKRADRCDVLSEVPKMLQNPNFPGLRPDPARGAYSAPQTP